MDSSLRASAFAGLGAFALSTIVALFSRIAIVTLLIRALLSGVAFAALVYGGLWVLRRVVPELFDDDSRSPDGVASMDGTGSVVDIVLPGGADDAVDMGAEPAVMVSAAGYDGADAGVAVEPASMNAPSGIAGRESLAEEVEELSGASLVAPAGAGGDASGDVSAGQMGGAAFPPSSAVSFDDLDTLPDMDGMGDSFSESVSGVSGSESPAPAELSGGGFQPSSSGSTDSGKDPVALAKAIQTLMRKDQKGQ